MSDRHDWMAGMTDFQRAEVARLESRIVSFEKRWESLEADWNDCKKALAAMRQQRDGDIRKIKEIEAMGYEWRWLKSIDAEGNQEGVWIRRVGWDDLAKEGP